MVRMCADGTLPPSQRLHYKNAIHGLYRIWKEDGLARCFRGVQLTLARSVVMNAAQLSWYVQITVCD
jgi:dicarboxylate transporter 10